MAASDNIQNDINSMSNQLDTKMSEVQKLDDQIQSLTNQADQKRNSRPTDTHSKQDPRVSGCQKARG
jgi:uncharacterized protein YoxC